MILPYSASSSPLTWYLCPLQQGPSSNPPSASPWLLTVDSRSAALTFMIDTRSDCCSPARPAHKAAAGEEDEVGQEADQDHHHRPHQAPGALAQCTMGKSFRWRVQ